MAEKSEDLLRLRDVRKFFPVGGRLPFSKAREFVQAVDGVSFDVRPHETFSLAGPWTVFHSTSDPTRPSAWRESPAAARRPPPK